MKNEKIHQIINHREQVKKLMWSTKMNCKKYLNIALSHYGAINNFENSDAEDSIMMRSTLFSLSLDTFTYFN